MPKYITDALRLAREFNCGNSLKSDNIDDDDLEALYASDGEEKVELEEVLNEEELEQMFQQVENEFR